MLSANASHYLPLPNAPEAAIIARNSPGIGGMSAKVRIVSLETALLSGEDALTRLGFTAFCLAILTLAGCSQVATDPAKAAADKPGAARSQAPASSPLPPERGGDGGGGGGY